MRLGIEIELSNPVIPQDYRRGFMSLIKAAIEKEDHLYFNSWYQDQTNKPFTFSIYFPGLKGGESNKLNVGKTAILNFSTNDLVLLANVYNGVQHLKEHKWGEYLFIHKKTKALINRKIKSDHCLFKTLSPFLVNNKGDKLTYLSARDSNFDEALRYSIHELCQKFLQISSPDFDYQFIEHKKMILTHYNQYMTTNKGIIEMKAQPEILNLLYDVGIGVRRSQGFGMLDLI